MSGEHDVKDIKEMNTFLAKLGNATSKSLADDKIDSNDAVNLVDPIVAAPAAFEGISNYGKQFKDMDESEALEIKQQLAADLQLDPDDAAIEELCELVVGATFQISAAIMAIVAAKKARDAKEVPSA